MDAAEIKLDRLRKEMERRQHHRVTATLSLRFKVIDGDGEGLAQLSNIGLAGARIDFPIDIPMPTSMTVELPAAKDDPRPLTLKAVVAWTVAGRVTAPYPTGVQFQDVDPETRNRLFRYIAALMD